MLSVDYFGLAGKSLSVNEVTALRCSMTLLSEKLKSTVTFWGKLLGYTNDYLIVQSLPEGTFGSRNSFFSVDGGVNWSPLPSTLTPEQLEFCEQLRGRFLGQPEYLYKVRRDVPPEPEVVPELPPANEEEENEDAEEAAAEDDEDKGEDAEAAPEAAGDEEGAGEGEEGKAPVKAKPKFQILTMPETCRVAHFVTAHDQACLLVPRGAYLLKGDDCAANRTFSGLDVDAAQQMHSYLRLHAPANWERNKAIYGPTFHTTTDFLTPIVEDRPEGMWSLKYDSSMGAVTVENLFFEGSLFWLKCNGGNQWGQVYIGTGERNLDLCFVLP